MNTINEQSINKGMNMAYLIRHFHLSVHQACQKLTKTNIETNQ